MNFRTKLIQIIVDVIERLIFYPKLKKYYLNRLANDHQRRINNKLTVIDVGSNKGQTINFFLTIDKHCRIFGFEPNKNLFKNLQIKYKNNSNIILTNLGLSSKIGKLLFYENIMDETSTFEKINFESVYLKKKAKILGISVNEIIVDQYYVDVITLNLFLKENPDIFIDILKIDVEGHEYNCLLGLFDNSMLKYPIRFIQIESHCGDMYIEDNNSIEKITELLSINNFEEVAKIKHSFGGFYEIIYENKRLNEA